MGAKAILKWGFRMAHRLGLRLGICVLPVHFYSPVPNLIELERTRDIWAIKSELPGIDIDLDRQARDLKRICVPFQKEYAGNHAFTEAVSGGLGLGYGYIEAQALHGVIRHFKPERIVEVGSGVSTYCILNATKLNDEETHGQTQVCCIEPYPSPSLEDLDGIRLLKSQVQTIDIDVFTDLQENDLLFIDSSHTVKTGSDVNRLILEILPRLRRGVIVHLHDITFPFDYSPDVLSGFRHWSETSLLRAYLIGNTRARILFCLSHLHYERSKVLEAVFPEYVPEVFRNGLKQTASPFSTPPVRHFPSSIYLQV